MRRILGLVSTGLGAMLIVLAVAMPTFVYPRVAKAPQQPDQFIRAQGTGITVLLPRSLDAGGARILANQTVVVTRKVDGDRPAGAKTPVGDERFYRLAFRAEVQDDGQLTEGDDGTLLAYVEGGSFDDQTGLATNCCGDYFATDQAQDLEPIEHEGLMFKFPFNAERKTYPFWDFNVREAVDAVYDRTETLNGLLVYRYVQNIKPTIIGQQALPGSLISQPDVPSVTADRYYQTERTLWVEPYTGAIIKGSERVNQYLLANGKVAPVFKGYLEYTPETVAANVDSYKSSAAGLRFVSRTGPIIFWIVGPILVLIGITLLALGRRRSADDWDDDWDDADSTSYQRTV